MADLKRGDLQQDESAVADPRRKWSTIRGTDDGFSGNSNQRFALAANCFDNGLDFFETPRL